MDVLPRRVCSLGWLSAMRYGGAPNVQPTVRLLSFSTPRHSDLNAARSNGGDQKQVRSESICVCIFLAVRKGGTREGGVIPDIRYIFTTEWAGSERMDRHRGMSGIGASWTGRGRPTTRRKLGLSIVSISNGNEDVPKRGNSDMAQILSRVSSCPVPPLSQVAGCDKVRAAIL